MGVCHNRKASQQAIDKVAIVGAESNILNHKQEAERANWGWNMALKL